MVCGFCESFVGLPELIGFQLFIEDLFALLISRVIYRGKMCMYIYILKLGFVSSFDLYRI